MIININIKYSIIIYDKLKRPFTNVAVIHKTDFMPTPYTSRVKSHRPASKFRTRNQLWLPNMVDLVQTLQNRIRELTDPITLDDGVDSFTGENTTPVLFRQLMTEASRDLNHDLEEEDVITLLIQNILSAPLVVSFFPGRKTLDGPTTIDRLTDCLLVALHPELACLDQFYDMVATRNREIDCPSARLTFITEIYDEFFRLSFPLVTEQLGIYYTPRAIVDFILHSVEYLLGEHGGRSLGDPDIHILDPFTGTGTFLTRLVTGNVLPEDARSGPLAQRLHGMEIVMLAASIARLQVESSLLDQSGQQVSWEGLQLADTFASYRPPDLLDVLDARPKTPAPAVIIGNPPWSISQRHADDDHPNAKYPWLDGRLRETYAVEGKGFNSVPLFDSYVRALRWSTDRLAANGIIGFVINSSFLMGKSLLGLRRSQVREFSHIYIVNLRGDIRNNIYSEWQTGEGENIFGSRTMMGSALLFLVRKPAGDQTPGRIFHHSLGDNLSTAEKRTQLDRWGSIANLPWQEIVPDANHDWFRPRNTSFADFPPVAPHNSKTDKQTWFQTTRERVKPASESWCINASREAVVANMTEYIREYNQAAIGSNVTPKPDRTANRIKWTEALRLQAMKGVEVDPARGKVQTIMLHPFVKRHLYVHPDLPFGRGFMDDLEEDSDNRLILPFPGGPELGFSALMVDVPPICSAGGANYCLPKSNYPPPPRQRPVAS